MRRPEGTASKGEVGGFSVTDEQMPWGGVVVTVRGELDVSSVPELRARLDAALASGTRRILLDLSDVWFIDSMSLATIVATSKRLEGDGRLAIVAGHPYVLLIFEASGLDSVLELYENRERAESYVKG